MSLLRSALSRAPESRAANLSLDDYAALVNEFTYNGLSYGAYGSGLQTTMPGQPAERIAPDFAGLASSAFQSNGIVFACMLVRQLAFSGVRFQWQNLRNGRASTVFGDQRLTLLETPWVGGTTQDLLARLIQDADLAGNSFWAKSGNELIRLRPDWVEIAAVERAYRGGVLGWQRIGYGYTEGGPGSGNNMVAFTPDEVAHFAPIPDPLARFRGMSWLTPVIREIQADQVMTTHKRRFFENGATPNMVVKHPEGATPEKIQVFADMLRQKHGGAVNAYKTLHLYPGADATVVGSNLHQIDFKTVQGAGETRIASAARVPPVLAGFSEGLQGSSLNQGNYAAARRAFADGTMHPLWQNAAGSLAPLLGPTRPGTRLWYDAHDVPFLREDAADAASIQQEKASTINTLISAGFTPDSVVPAVEAADFSLLVHSGLTSVQLQKPGTTDTNNNPDTGEDANV